MIEAGYKQARAGHEAAYYSLADSVDWFQVDCRQVTQKENASEWLVPGRWHILVFHGIGTWDDGWEPVTAEQFAAEMAELASYRDSGAVEVLTFKEGAERVRRKSGGTRCAQI